MEELPVSGSANRGLDMSCPDEARPVAVVTGASAGLGRAAAIALAQSGFNLALTDLDAGLLDETLKLVCDEIGRAHV